MLSNCTKPDTVVQTSLIEKNIPIQPRPRPVNLTDVKFYVVTEENLDQFIEEFKKKNLELVFVALSIDDYETLSLNLAELKRYIEQQGQLIVYYENSVAK